METIEHAAWWKSVLTRDRKFDGVFVYGVQSTGIYCRPSCGARKPGANQVVFFNTPQDARTAGFRACRRCLPDEAVTTHPHVEAVRRLCRYIEEYDSPDRPLTLEAMGDHVGISPHHLQRTFTHIMGVSPRQYAEARRLARLKTLVRQGENVTKALYEAGYGSSSRLYDGVVGRMGMTPGTYRKGGKGMRIRYTTIDSPLGKLLIAATEKGICAVHIGDAEKDLENALLKEYPAAEVRRDETGLGDYIGQFLRYLEGRSSVLDLPRDVLATAFQARVYEILRNIPYGSVRTYKEVAEAIGNPRAIRAVAHACAANPTALLVPCHRVVRADGNLGGYRWGLERKKTLLEWERRSNRAETFENGAGI